MAELTLTFGQRLKFTREAWNLSIQEAALRMSISDQQLSNWENDLSRPGDYVIAGLALVYRVTPEFLKTGRIEESHA
jgi:transcriptional regulator with XRE-family HTH domain